jgi:hypothetical protein
VGHAIAKDAVVTVTGSLNVTVTSELVETFVALFAGLVAVTVGALSGDGGPECAPSPSNVSIAKPSHSTDGSNASDPAASPASIVDFRRSVLSAVLVSPLPHSVPVTVVSPLKRATASSPLNQPAVRLVGLGEDRSGGERLGDDVDVAARDGAGEVDPQCRHIVAVEEHPDAVAAGREIDRRAGAVEDLEGLVVARSLDVLREEDLGRRGLPRRREHERSGEPCDGKDDAA